MATSVQRSRAGYPNKLRTNVEARREVTLARSGPAGGAARGERGGRGGSASPQSRWHAEVQASDPPPSESRDRNKGCTQGGTWLAPRGVAGLTLIGTMGML